MGASVTASSVPIGVVERPAPLTDEVLCSWRGRILHAVFDIAALALAWQSTKALRLALNPFFSLQLKQAEIDVLAPQLTGILALWLVAAWRLKLYGPRTGATRESRLFRAAESVLVVGVLTIVVTFFSRELGAELSRSFVVLYVPVSFCMMLGGRYAAYFTVRLFENKWPSAPERIAVIGDVARGSRMIDHLRRTCSQRASVAGLILPDTAPWEGHAGGHVILGTTASLAETINRAQLDRVIVLDRGLPEREIEHCASVANRMSVPINRVVGAPERNVRAVVSEMYGLRLLEVRPVAFTRTQEWIKRIFDVAVGGLALVALSPLLVLIAGLVRVTSPGPALYRSRRVGKGGRHFTFYKFRTMRSGSAARTGLDALNEKQGHIFKIRTDPRITSLGRNLRRWSLDELPQLINVFRGDMSIVGPRPLPATDLDPDGQSRQFRHWAELRSRVAPGITGLWQIRGRSDLAFEQMVELDIDYIQNWSLALDLQVLLETPLVVLTGKGAY